MRQKQVLVLKINSVDFIDSAALKYGKIYTINISLEDLSYKT